MALLKLAEPWPLRTESRNICLVPGMLHAPGAGITDDWVILPLSSRAMAINGLKVEPGGYRPWVTRLMSGLCQFSFNAFQFSLSMPSMKRLGLKDGLDTKASTPPVCGLMATMAPRLPRIRRTASCCRRMSIASFRVWPFCGGTVRRVRMMLP